MMNALGRSGVYVLLKKPDLHKMFLPSSSGGVYADLIIKTNTTITRSSNETDMCHSSQLPSIIVIITPQHMTSLV